MTKVTHSCLWGVCLAGCLQGSDLICLEPVHDAGAIDLKKGTRVISHDFLVENHSKRGVKISRLVISCSCMSIDAPGYLAPGQSAPFTAKMNLEEADFAGRSAEVLVEDDSGGKPLILKFKAKSKSVLHAIPRAVDFGEVRGTGNLERDVYVYMPSSTGEGRFVSGVSCSDPRVKVAIEWQKRNSTGDQFLYYAKCRVTLRPSEKEGEELASEIVLDTLQGGKLVIPVSAKPDSSRVIEPSSYHIYTSRFSGDFTYSGSYGKPAKFTFSSKAVKLREVVELSGKFVCKFEGDAAGGEELGEFVVTTEKGDVFRAPLARGE